MAETEAMAARCTWRGNGESSDIECDGVAATVRTQGLCSDYREFRYGSAGCRRICSERVAGSV